MINLIPGKLYKVTRDECFGYAISIDKNDNVTLLTENDGYDGYVDLSINDIIMYLKTSTYNGYSYECFMFKNKLLMQRNINGTPSHKGYLKIQPIE